MKTNAIYCGDSIELLNSWPAGSVDLVFADPPYNIGYIYDKYHDDLPHEQFVEWTSHWMKACQRVLKPSGSFYIAIGDDYAAETRILGRKLGMPLRNWIIWHYTFGQNMRVKFTRAHTHILYFTMQASGFTFNDQLLRFPSARHTEYQDLRASRDGRLPDDVWDEFPRVCGTFKEREGFHGCQLPEALLMRIIMASSNPGDVVLDPFVGSGTTAAVAKRLGRKYVGIDLSEEYAARARARLASVQDESKARWNPERWPTLHEDILAQLFRETKVTLPNLRDNRVALDVIARSLNRRCNHAGYTVEHVRDKLNELAATLRLPKLPNDTPFKPRNHVRSEGKKYDRAILRYRGRRFRERAADDGARYTVA